MNTITIELAKSDVLNMLLGTPAPPFDSPYTKMEGLIGTTGRHSAWRKDELEKLDIETLISIYAEGNWSPEKLQATH